MAARGYGANTITAGGTDFLLTTTSGGLAVHLAGPPKPSLPGRGAVPDFYYASRNEQRAARLRGYDRAALLDPSWSQTTLCGRTWAVMIGGDGGSVSEYREIAFAPTCRRCLSLIDRFFPEPRVDGRLALVAQLAADLVGEHGCAEIRNVPGDQQAALRKAIRSVVRTQTGQASRTYVFHNAVHVVCQAIFDRHAMEYSHAAMDAVSDLLFGDGQPRPAQLPDWIILWDAWNVDS
jgi:hypothetical protein